LKYSSVPPLFNDNNKCGYDPITTAPISRSITFNLFCSKLFGPTLRINNLTEPKVCQYEINVSVVVLRRCAAGWGCRRVHPRPQRTLWRGAHTRRTRAKHPSLGTCRQHTRCSLLPSTDAPSLRRRRRTWRAAASRRAAS
jgi:hypothetical protein